MGAALYSIALGALLSACGGGSSANSSGGATVPIATATPAPLTKPIVAGQALPPAGSIYLGGYINSSGLPNDFGPSVTAAFETQIGRKLALDVSYDGFTAKFPARNQFDDYSNGRIPIYSWNCGISNALIAAGAADSTLRSQASAIAAYGWPVFVRYMWDMNLPSSNFSRTGCFDKNTDGPGQYFAPGQFIAAWQHIRQIFREQGAVNAVWIWTIGQANGTSQPYFPGEYYPGDSQVDWVGMDSYDINNGGFASTFSTLYPTLITFNKPIMISETGAAAPIQSTFFNAAVPTLQTQFPAIKAFVYYDGIGSQDWRITAASFPAFSAFAHDPYTGGMYPAP